MMKHVLLKGFRILLHVSLVSVILLQTFCIKLVVKYWFVYNNC
jgi:hypothetical protein